MLATSIHVKRKKDEENPLNLAIIAEVEESSPVVDVDEIIARNNITDLCTLEIPHDIAISKNMKIAYLHIRYNFLKNFNCTIK
jgi:hypothetical protein